MLNLYDMVTVKTIVIFQMAVGCNIWMGLFFHQHLLSQSSESVQWERSDFISTVRSLLCVLLTDGDHKTACDSLKLMERVKSVAYFSISLWKLVISYDSISIAAARVTEARQVSRNIHFRVYYVIHLYMDYWMTFLGDVMPASGYEVVWVIHSIFAFPPLYYSGRSLLWSCFSFFLDVVCAMWFFTWLFKL